MNPLLFDLFDEIRKDQRWPGPGLQEYYLFLELLACRKEYPVRHFDDLAFAMETLWLKSPQQREAFRQLLQLRRAALLQLTAPELPPVPPGEVRDDEIFPPNNDGKGRPPNTDPKLPLEESEKPQVEPPQPQEQKAHETNIDQDNEIMFSLGSQQGGASADLGFEAPQQKTTLLQSPFLFTSDYFPVKNRHLQQAWRSLNNRQEGQDMQEPDMRKTIFLTAKKGFFAGFVPRKEIVNRLSLFIFIDRSETMSAVEEFGSELCAAAGDSDKHEEVKPWYFYDLPRYDTEKDDYIFSNNDLTGSTGIRNLFRKQGRRNIAVLIYSDAGALRGGFDEERIAGTGKFISFLNANAGYTAWINPAPRERWKNTNAEMIRNMIQMFDTSRAGVENAIGALKGKISSAAQPGKYATP